MDANVDRPGSQWAADRDLALTAMLIVQCLVIFVAAPSVSAGFPGSIVGFELLFVAFGSLIIVVSRGRIATTMAALAMTATLTGTFLTVVAPAITNRLLVHLGTIGGAIVVTFVVGRAVFAPGVVTQHRVLGAIVLYLTFGMLCTSGYRLIWDLIPNSLTGIPTGLESRQVSGTILYFSFVTLTTVGYGDIVPIHPFARGLANLEGIVGQLYPATLLARLITLELEARHR